MPLLRTFLNLLRRRRLERDMAEEMRLHVEHRTAQAMAGGLDPAAAAREARLRFGPVDAAQEAARETRTPVWLGQLYQDLGYAGRGLRRAPGFAAVIILTLAVGIAGNTACFSLLNSLFLRPFAYPASDRIVFIGEAPPGEIRQSAHGDSFARWSQHRDLFEAFGGYHHLSVPLIGRGAPTSESLYLVTEETLAVYGARYREGRGFLADEFQPGHNRVVILSHEFWQHRLGGEPNLLGTPLTLNGQDHRVVGILEPDAFPFSNHSIFAPSDIVSDEAARAPGTTRSLAVQGLLLPGVSPAQAQARFETLRRSQSAENSGERQDWNVTVQTWREASFGSQRPVITLTTLVVAAVLLIACINITNLVLARNSARSAEISLRLALGASTGRIVRQLLTETMVLAAVGGLLGGFGGAALYQATVRWLGMDRLKTIETEFDHRVLLFTVATTLACGLICGLLPALRCVRPRLSSTLKSADHGGATGRRGRLQSALVIAESAFTVTLLILAALLLRSLQAASTANPGFDPDGVLCFRIHFPPDTAPDLDDAVIVFNQVLDAVRALPGVESAAMASSVPLGPAAHHVTQTVRRSDQPSESGGLATAVGTATPDFWATLHIPLLRGRVFRESDNRTTAAPTVVVNAELVRRLFKNDADAALGSYLKWRDRDYEIVGVVGDTSRYYLGQPAEPQLYVLPVFFVHANNFILRAQVDPLSLVDDVRAAMARLHPNAPVNHIGGLRDSADNTLAFNRSVLTVIGLFAVIGLVLAAMGVFGVMTYTATRRSREMGIRIALGASTRNIMSLILGDSLRLIGIGMLMGCLLAVGASQLLATQLHQIGRLDPASYLLAVATLASIGAGASLMPAWRASRADPIIALRAQ